MNRPWRTVLVLVAALLLAGAFATPRYRVIRAARDLSTAGTAEFTSRHMSEFVLTKKILRVIATLNQELRFEAETCSLTVTSKHQRLWQMDQEPPSVDRDYTTVSVVRLGTIESIQVTPRVKTEGVSIAEFVSATPDSYHLIVRSSDRIRRKLIPHRADDPPIDSVDSLLELHLKSTQPLSQVTDALLYLDRTCGNPRTIAPSFVP